MSQRHYHIPVGDWKDMAQTLTDFLFFIVQADSTDPFNCLTGIQDKCVWLHLHVSSCKSGHCVRLAGGSSVCFADFE